MKVGVQSYQVVDSELVCFRLLDRLRCT